jgi:hypothetical protein
MNNWHAVESLRWVGLLSLTIIIATGIVPMLKMVNSSSQSISQLWASAEKHQRLISVIVTVFGAGLSAYIIGWLIPTYQLWVGMYLIALAGYSAILVVAWLPMTKGPGEHSLRHPHFIGGAVVAYGAVAGYLVILLTGIAIPRGSYNTVVIALIYSALWPIFFLSGVRKYFMVLETILIVLFIAVITTLTFGW